MAKKQTIDESRRQYWSDYWRDHADEINKRRRERYRKDASYRKAARERSKKYREDRADQAERPARVGDAYERLGITRKAIRYWEAQGWVPKRSRTRAQRVYTDTQLKLLAYFKAFLDEWPRADRTDPKFQRGLQRRTAIIKERWST